MADELKPCPFCGGKPYILEDEYYGTFEVGCNNRKCKLVVYTNDIAEKKKAIAAWNKRVDNAL